VRSLILIAAMVIADAAEAASGAVFAQVAVYQNNNDYCPNAQDCTAGQYTQAQIPPHLPPPFSCVVYQVCVGCMVTRGLVVDRGASASFNPLP